MKKQERAFKQDVETA